MVVFTNRPQQLTDIRSLPVGVFEDDALLLRLAARCRCVGPGWPRASGPVDADDLALEVARRAEIAEWNL